MGIELSKEKHLEYPIFQNRASFTQLMIPFIVKFDLRRYFLKFTIQTS